MSVCESCNFNTRTSADLYVGCAKSDEPIPAWQTHKCPKGIWKDATEGMPPKALGYKTQDNKMIELQGLYKDRSCFLICCGPSLKTAMTLWRKRRLGDYLTMGLNNSPAVFQPNLWCCVDGLYKFPRWVYRSKEVTKFIPVRRWDEPQMADAVSVYGYAERNRFQWWRFLADEIVTWGNQTMMIAIRLLFDLGIRRVFIIGADFHMEPGDGAYGDGRYGGPQLARNNNESYAKLDGRFALLRPYLERFGMYIYNATPGSRLTAFDTISYDEAIDLADQELENAALDENPPP